MGGPSAIGELRAVALELLRQGHIMPDGADALRDYLEADQELKDRVLNETVDLIYWQILGSVLPARRPTAH